MAGRRGLNPSDPMSNFKIKVARIESAARGKRDAEVCITFQVDRGSLSFQVPIRLSMGISTIRKWFEQREMRCIGRSWSSRPKAKPGS